MRFSVDALAPGCWNSTSAMLPMSNLYQSMIARSEVWSMVSL
jgi:hypothetical protein